MTKAARKKQQTAPITDKGPTRPSHCAAYLRRELTKSFRGIVSGFVKQAESGSVPHFKLTNELLQQRPAPRKRKGSAQRLLEELERMDGETAGTTGAPQAECDDVWRD